MNSRHLSVFTLALFLSFSAVSTATAFAEAPPTKVTKANKAPKVNTKASLKRTDSIIRTASKGAKEHLMRGAVVHQLAARKALTEGKDKAAMYLTLRARHIAREGMKARGVKIPKAMRDDSKVETGHANEEGTIEFLEMADWEVPIADDIDSTEDIEID